MSDLLVLAGETAFLGAIAISAGYVIIYGQRKKDAPEKPPAPEEKALSSNERYCQRKAKLK